MGVGRPSPVQGDLSRSPRLARSSRSVSSTFPVTYSTRACSFRIHACSLSCVSANRCRSALSFAIRTALSGELDSSRHTPASSMAYLRSLVTRFRQSVGTLRSVETSC